MKTRSRAARVSADFPDGKPGSKAGHVYEEIKEAILSGSLEPGSSIDKTALSERLGMSRFPISAAINRLAFERLVVIEPQHGSFVAKIALSDVRDCMLIRRAVEGDIAAEAARTGSVDLVEVLERNLRYQAVAAQAEDRAGLYALDVEFHRAIVGDLGLQHSNAVLDSLRAHLERIRRILMTPPGRMAQTQEEHGAVVAAIASGDPDAARAAMRHHLDQTTTMFKSFASQNPSLFSETP